VIGVNFIIFITLFNSNIREDKPIKGFDRFKQDEEDQGGDNEKEDKNNYSN
jgi:hypothetical protein